MEMEKTMSIACTLGGKNINSKRCSALAAAYSLTESQLKNYQKKVFKVRFREFIRGVVTTVEKLIKKIFKGRKETKAVTEELPEETQE